MRESSSFSLVAREAWRHSLWMVRGSSPVVFAHLISSALRTCFQSWVKAIVEHTRQNRTITARRRMPDDDAAELDVKVGDARVIVFLTGSARGLARYQ